MRKFQFKYEDGKLMAFDDQGRQICWDLSGTQSQADAYNQVPALGLAYLQLMGVSYSSASASSEPADGE